MRKGFSIVVATIIIGGIAAATAEPTTVELITKQEAALPDAVGLNIDLGLRGVTRGPSVEVLSPAPGAGFVKSPLDLMLKFEAHGGGVIDPRTVKVTYLKKPAINLTPRISDWIKGDGFEIPAVEIPPGTHYLKVEVKDNAGRLGSTVFPVRVEN